jgi:hypothetical protein
VTICVTVAAVRLCGSGVMVDGQFVANATDTATGQTHALLLTSN